MMGTILFVFPGDRGHFQFSLPLAEQLIQGNIVQRVEYWVHDNAATWVRCLFESFSQILVPFPFLFFFFFFFFFLFYLYSIKEDTGKETHDIFIIYFRLRSISSITLEMWRQKATEMELEGVEGE